MPLEERLVKALGEYTKEDFGDDYVFKLPRANFPEETSLYDVRGNEEFIQSLKEAGLTTMQRASITRVLGDCWLLPGSNEAIAIGDIKSMTDEQLGYLGSDMGRGWRAGKKTKMILRNLFGKSE